MGLLRILDIRCMDKLVGWSWLSGDHLDGMDFRGLGLEGALDVMDGLFSDNYGDCHVYHHGHECWCDECDYGDDIWSQGC